MPTTQSYITPDAFLAHWQAHRALTRKVILAFPEDQLFSFSVGGMRPFALLANEMLGMHAPMARGVATGEWPSYAESEVSTRDELLAEWDRNTAEINEIWPSIPAARFHERMNAFGLYEGPAHELLLYSVDNEIHHRGQGYVYLRALGVEPPSFWDR